MGFGENEKMRLKKIFTNWRVILLLFLLAVSLISISPVPGRDGVAIRSVDVDSAVALAGIVGPDSSVRPLQREIITSIDGQHVSDMSDYKKLTSNLVAGQELIIKTNKKTYDNIIIQEKIDGRVIPGEFDYIQEEIFNETLNQTQNITKKIPKINTTVVGVKDLGLNVYDAPSSNLRKGLDLQGGTRILIRPEENITSEQFESVKTNLETRLNLFGLSDVQVNIVKDFNFNPEYILIEIAGTSVERIEELVLSQGKFEAKIGNITVFSGEKNDVPYVGKSATQARISGCNAISGGYSCRFEFQIKLSPDAAKRQGETTMNLGEVSENGQSYLDKDLDLYLDGKLIDSLKIATSLKGKTTITDILISGSGSGITKQDAIENTSSQMKQLQTVIETGSLPTKLVIEKIDTISAVLGKNFLRNAVLTGLAALFSVATILFIRYRKFSIIIPMVLALVSEVTLILGLYSIMGTLDLAAIAGIIILVGTGVDHLVIITDGVSEGKEDTSWKLRLKSAFAIIIGAFLTTTFAMLPLMIAGAGLLRGFAITTIVGLFFGIFITRPAYAKVIENLD